MKVIRKINNNVAICVDRNGHELVAFGKGIGFHEIPYELSDLSKVDRTFYGLDTVHLRLFEDVEQKYFEIATRIVTAADQRLHCILNPNVIFTLADHISFMVSRCRKNMYLTTPLSNEIQQFYEEEMNISREAIAYISRLEGMNIPQSEAAGIAMQLINAKQQDAKDRSRIEGQEKLLEEVTQLIEKETNTTIARDDVNYSRFVMHMNYLFKQPADAGDKTGDNRLLCANIRESYPDMWNCAEKCADHIEQKLNRVMREEDVLYLTIHIQRMCTRQENHQ